MDSAQKEYWSKKDERSLNEQINNYENINKQSEKDTLRNKRMGDIALARRLNATDDGLIKQDKINQNKDDFKYLKTSANVIKELNERNSVPENVAKGGKRRQKKTKKVKRKQRKSKKSRKSRRH